MRGDCPASTPLNKKFGMTPLSIGFDYSNRKGAAEKTLCIGLLKEKEVPTFLADPRGRSGWN